MDQRSLIKFDTSVLENAPLVIPVGWSNLWSKGYAMIERLNGSFVRCFRDNKGLFRIKGTSNNSFDEMLIKRLLQTIAKDSALICMECGQPGFRRKMETDWPCLCKSHYIEYVNIIN
jgi:hypothetical protein